MGTTSGDTTEDIPLRFISQQVTENGSSAQVSQLASNDGARENGGSGRNTHRHVRNTSKVQREELTDVEKGVSR
jgi:hypothetical protein